MSLGVLGQYGSESGSSISDSDEDYDGNKDVSTTEPFSKSNLNSSCTDPLSLGLGGSADESLSDSSSECRSSSSPLPVDTQVPLPLPDIDSIVARNASYSSSELVNSSSDIWTEGTVTEESSVFFNPYKKAEEDRLAILKRHVSEFDKKPDIKETQVAWNENRSNLHVHSSDNRSRTGSSRAEIPPPAKYTRHVHSHSSSGSTRVGPQSSIPPPAMAKHPDGSADRLYMHSHHYQESNEARAEDLFDDKDSSILVKKPRKHRSGVGDSLTPPKKFMKMHQQIQARERPWTLKH